MLSSLKGFTLPRTNVDILNCVAISATCGAFEVLATDTAGWWRNRVPCDGDLASVAVHHGRLTDAVLSLCPGPVSIDHASGRLCIRAANGGKRSLATVSATDLPDIGPHDFPDAVTLDAATLRDALAFVAPAMSTEPTRYYLHGTYLHSEAGRLIAVALNGNQLHMASLGEGHLAGRILPFAFVNDLLRALERRDGEVTLRFSDRLAEVEIGDRLMRRKLVDGQFPDYRKAFPEGHGGSLTVTADELARAVEAVSRGARVGGVDGIVIRLALSDDGVSASQGLDPLIGGDEPVAGTSYQGAPMTLGFRRALLASTLLAWGENSIDIALDADSTMGAVITCPSRPDRRAVVMQCRI